MYRSTPGKKVNDNEDVEGAVSLMKMIAGPESLRRDIVKTPNTRRYSLTDHVDSESDVGGMAPPETSPGSSVYDFEEPPVSKHSSKKTKKRYFDGEHQAGAPSSKENSPDIDVDDDSAGDFVEGPPLDVELPDVTANPRGMQPARSPLFRWDTGSPSVQEAVQGSATDGVGQQDDDDEDPQTEDLTPGAALLHADAKAHGRARKRVSRQPYAIT